MLELLLGIGILAALSKAFESNIIIKADPYGLRVSDGDLDYIHAIYEEGDIDRHFSEDVMALAVYDGEIVGAITQSNVDEWTLGVDPGYQGSDIATDMVKALIARDASGFMIAGTDKGAAFIHALYWKLSPEEREHLDVPSWEDIEQETE